VACKNKNKDMVQLIFTLNNDRCLMPNYYGQTPLMLATMAQDEAVLYIFAQYKWEGLKMKDHLGENPLFPCARNGNEKIFNWFAGHNEFFKARGTQNYKGQTIEHIVCLHKRSNIV